MILVVGREYRVKGYAYPLKLEALNTRNGVAWATLRVGAMVLHVTVDKVLGGPPCER